MLGNLLVHGDIDDGKHKDECPNGEGECVADEEDRTSHLRLAVENNKTDLDKERAKQLIDWPLRELASNIIRVVRGAGKSYEIGRQCVAVIEAFQQYRDKVGHWPSSWEIDQALSVRRENSDPTYGHQWKQDRAIENIMRGALQMSASRLVGQSTQEQRGESELYDGVNRLEEACEASRKHWAEVQKAQEKLSKGSSTKKVVRRKARPDIKL